MQVGRAAGWLAGAMADPRGAGSAVDALIAKGPRRAEVSRLQTALPLFVEEARRTVGAAWIARIRDRVGGLSDLQALVGVLDKIPGRQDRQAALKEALQPVTKLMHTLPGRRPKPTSRQPVPRWTPPSGTRSGMPRCVSSCLPPPGRARAWLS